MIGIAAFRPTEKHASEEGHSQVFEVSAQDSLLPGLGLRRSPSQLHACLQYKICSLAHSPRCTSVRVRHNQEARHEGSVEHECVAWSTMMNTIRMPDIWIGNSRTHLELQRFQVGLPQVCSKVEWSGDTDLHRRCREVQRAAVESDRMKWRKSFTCGHNQLSAIRSTTQHDYHQSGVTVDTCVQRRAAITGEIHLKGKIGNLKGMHHESTEVTSVIRRDRRPTSPLESYGTMHNCNGSTTDWGYKGIARGLRE